MNCDASISKLIPLEFPIPVCGFMATYLSRTVFPSFSLGFLSTSRNADLALEKMWVMTRPSGRFSVLHALAKPLADGFVNVEAA
jgi:hypothetical protein